VIQPKVVTGECELCQKVSDVFDVNIAGISHLICKRCAEREAETVFDSSAAPSSLRFSASAIVARIDERAIASAAAIKATLGGKPEIALGYMARVKALSIEIERLRKEIGK
jgi:hypothetical protein